MAHWVKLITYAESGLSDEVLRRIIPLIGGEYLLK